MLGSSSTHKGGLQGHGDAQRQSHRRPSAAQDQPHRHSPPPSPHACPKCADPGCTLCKRRASSLCCCRGEAAASCRGLLLALQLLQVLQVIRMQPQSAVRPQGCCAGTPARAWHTLLEDELCICCGINLLQQTAVAADVVPAQASRMPTTAVKIANAAPPVEPFPNACHGPLQCQQRCEQDQK